MIRILVFFAVILMAALGLGWLADRPGDVTLVWQGASYKISLMTALGGLAAVAIGAILLWSVLSTVFRLPGLVSSINRMRRRAKGMNAVSRGIIAVGAGDLKRAERQARDAERLLGTEPLALLLKAQADQMAGDKSNAENAFRAMLDDPETRILGLRGLFVEARRRADRGAARNFAEEAYRLAPTVPWAGEAVLEHRCAEGDWRGAMETVEQNASRRLIDRDTARRQRAVLLAAQAEAQLDRLPDDAARSAFEALKLEPGLVPAALIAGARLSAKGDYARASKLLEVAWKLSPHPDLADAYLDVRPGDSAGDKLKRARLLAKMQPRERESRFALAKAAQAAREFGVARAELDTLILDKPTARACQMMADLEMTDGNRAAQSREWLSRAARAPRDPAWVADGFVSEHWLPLSPITGRLDAFIWQEPPQALQATLRAELDADKIIADHDEAPIRQIEMRNGSPAVTIEAPAEPIATVPAPIAAPTAIPRFAAKPSPAIFPVAHAPDDPGPKGP